MSKQLKYILQNKQLFKKQIYYQNNGLLKKIHNYLSIIKNLITICNPELLIAIQSISFLKNN